MSQKTIIARPVNINLFKIRLPISALISITHRISGMYVFFVTLPLSIFLFRNTSSELSFSNVNTLLKNNNILSTFVYFSFLVFLYHIMTGFRHLLMDIHIGENLKAANASAYVVIGLWLLASLFTFFRFGS